MGIPKGYKMSLETIEKMRKAHTGLTIPVEFRFWKKVEKQSNGCWWWTASRNGDGYGSFYYKGKIERAHRSSYQMFIGEIPLGVQVLHKCDTPRCVNPEHLFLGTQLDNIYDAKKKGRLKGCEGYHHSQEVKTILSLQRKGVPKSEETKKKVRETKRAQGKLDYAKVMEIKILREQGLSYAKIAKRYKVNKVSIFNVIKGKTWVN